MKHVEIFKYKINVYVKVFDELSDHESKENERISEELINKLLEANRGPCTTVDALYGTLEIEGESILEIHIKLGQAEIIIDRFIQEHSMYFKGD